LINWHPWITLVRAIGAIVRHTILIAVFIALFYGIEREFRYFWGAQEPMLFGRVPFNWLFDSIDALFVLLFGTLGVLEVYRIFQGQP
jgi:hypothetical protein